MAKALNTKGSNVITRVALPVKLERIAAAVAGAMQETVSLSETLGSLTREAGALIVKSPELCDPFVDACRQLCEASGLTDGSFKVYMSNIRGVVRAMVDGYKPKDGQSLRAMYDAAPKGKGANKGNTSARKPRPADGTAQTETGSVGDGDESVAASYSRVKATPLPTAGASVAERRHAAMIVLFGHADDELDAALTWAAKHELSFVRYVKANLAVVANAPAIAASVKVATMAPAVSAKGKSTAPMTIDLADLPKMQAARIAKEAKGKSAKGGARKAA